MRKGIVLGAALVAFAVAAPSLAQNSPENMVKYRQSVMKAIGGHTGAIASVVKGEVSFGGHVANHARGIKEMSGLVKDIFPAGTGSDSLETRALPAIWAKPDDFKAAVAAFEDAAGKLVAAAESGDQGAVAAGLGDLGKSCGGCHKPFRAEKK